MTQHSQWSVATTESESMNHDALLSAYAARGRHYHNLQHIEDCLAALASVDARTGFVGLIVGIAPTHGRHPESL
jgi:predicted metal-dependent HD superfamily phosphohydrolase